MTRKAYGADDKSSIFRRRVSPIIIIINVALIIGIFLLFWRYASAYRQRYDEENLGNIENLNQSAAINATSLIQSWNIKLEDTAQYIESNNMNYEQALDFIYNANSNDSRYFELIKSDYTGFLIRRDKLGRFIPVDYTASAYAKLRNVFDDKTDSAYEDICFAPEFTDSGTAIKHFAIYKHLTLSDKQQGEQICTLLLSAKSQEVLAVFNKQKDYEGQSTVLIDASGNYIVSNYNYKSENFFRYLYVYNDLTLDSKNSIEQQMKASANGVLYYKSANYSGEECVFRYDRMDTNDWYCVTCVPISSFRTPDLRTGYLVYAVLMILALLIFDITWLQLANSYLRTSMLREKEAGDAKTDFLSRMSHDIRTPLNGIIGLTTLAIEEPDSALLKEYLENIRVSGQFLTGLVNDILDMSKVESGKVELRPEPYSQEDFCKYIQAVVTPLCEEKHQKFVMSKPDGFPPAMLDRLRFNQIIFNLLSNAVKYTPEGGLIELYWHTHRISDSRVKIHMTVRDNGIGISRDFQKHMFESFSQEYSQTATTGAGLGLAIVNGLVKLMNGTVSVQSEPGEGSSFEIRIEADLCCELQVSEGETHKASLEGMHMLVCEDNQINILVVEKLLQKWGVSADIAQNGKIGVEMFTDSGEGAYDAILMDVMMPEMNGLEAARAIRGLNTEYSSAIPIVAMTANAYDTDVANCLEAGMNGHIGKPVDPDKLRDMLTKLL